MHNFLSAVKKLLTTQPHLEAEKRLSRLCRLVREEQFSAAYAMLDSDRQLLHAFFDTTSPTSTTEFSFRSAFEEVTNQQIVAANQVRRTSPALATEKLQNFYRFFCAAFNLLEPHEIVANRKMQLSISLSFYWLVTVGGLSVENFFNDIYCRAPECVQLSILGSIFEISGDLESLPKKEAQCLAKLYFGYLLPDEADIAGLFQTPSSVSVEQGARTLQIIRLLQNSQLPSENWPIYLTNPAVQKAVDAGLVQHHSQLDALLCSPAASSNHRRI